MDLAELNDWARAWLSQEEVVRRSLIEQDDESFRFLHTYEMSDGFAVEEFVQSFLDDDNNPCRALALRLSGEEVVIEETRWDATQLQWRLAETP